MERELKVILTRWRNLYRGSSSHGFYFIFSSSQFGLVFSKKKVWIHEIFIDLV